MNCPTCGKSLSTNQGVKQHHTKVHGVPLPNRRCVSCGETFYDPKSRRKYCTDCYSESGSRNGNFRDRKNVAECQICETEFKYYPSNKEGLYCSTCVSDPNISIQNINSTQNKIKVECKNCGDELRRYPSEISGNNYGPFCDKECYGNWLSDNIHGKIHHQWSGGTISYGIGWWKIRRKARKRDQYRCQNCGSGSHEIGRNPDVHHIDPVRNFANPKDAHTLDNVITLCRSCHRDVEEGNTPLPESD